MGATVATGWLTRARRALWRPRPRPASPARVTTYVVEALAIVHLPSETTPGHESELANRLGLGVEDLLARHGITDQGDGVQVKLTRQRPKRAEYSRPHR